MKKISMTLGLALCMGLTNIGVMAQESVEMSILQPVSDGELIPVHQINMNVPITRAEFIIAIIQTTGEKLPSIMDTHYALPAMERAKELELIDLDKYPMNTWSQPMTTEEKTEVLSIATKNNTIDMEKVYAALNKLLVEKVEIDGKKVDLGGVVVSHSNGKLMLPLRPIAEAMGFEVIWNKQEYSATLNNGKIQSTVQVGLDSYCYSSVNAIGMSKPFSTGVAPRFIDGITYVPVEYFSMFADNKISNETVYFTMK